MKNKFSALFNRRLVALLLAAITFTSAMPIEVFASQASAKKGVAVTQSAEGLANPASPAVGENGKVQEIALNPNSAIQNLADGNIIAMGEDGTATLENSSNPTQHAAAGTATPTQEQNDGSLDVAKELKEYGYYYDENAAKYAENSDTLDYVGSIPGAGLAAYRVDIDENTVETDEAANEDEIANIRAYYENVTPNADKAAAMMEKADAVSAEVKAQLVRDSGSRAQLNTNVESKHFQVVPIDLASGEMPDTVDALYSADYMDSNYQRAVRRPEADVYIVDDKAIIIKVTDENGVGINGAVVTINAGGKIRTGTTAKINQVDGIAILLDMAGISSGMLNIEREGYRIVTEEDIDMKGGTMVERRLKKISPNDFYIRSMSIGGAEMMNKTANLWLTPTATKSYPILVTLATGSENMLNDVRLILKVKRKDGSEKELARLSPGNAVGKYSRQYTSEKKWSEIYKGADELFREGDTLIVEDDKGHQYESQQPKLEVKNSPLHFEPPKYLNSTFSLFGKQGFTIPETMPVVGGAKAEVDFLGTDYILMLNPSGFGIFSCNVQIDEVIKKDDFFKKPFEPRQGEKTEKVQNEFTNNFSKKVNQFKNGRAHMANKTGKTFLDSKSGVEVSIGSCGKISYEWGTGYFTIASSVILTIEGSFGTTYYVLIPPPGFPVYAGVNVTLGASASGGVSAEFKPTDPFGTFSLRGGEGSGLSFEPFISLAAYIGAGIHGLFCVEAKGDVNLSLSMSLKANANRPPDKPLNRTTMFLSSNFTLEAVALIFRASKSWPFHDPVCLYDSWGIEGKLEPNQFEPETKLYEVTYPGSEGEAPEFNTATGTLASAEAAAVNLQPEQEYANGEDEADGNIFKVVDTMSANMPIKYVTVGGKNYVFRIAYMKYSRLGSVYPTVVYQKENPDGVSFENKLYMVPNYDWDYCYDYDFDIMVVPNSTGTASNDVLLAVQTGQKRTFNNDFEYVTKNTIIRSVRLNMPENKLVKQLLLSDQKNNGNVARLSPKLTDKNGESSYGWINLAWIEGPDYKSVMSKKNTTLASVAYRFRDNLVEASSYGFREGTVIEIADGVAGIRGADGFISKSTILGVLRFGEPNEENTHYEVRIANDLSALAREDAPISNLQPLGYNSPMAKAGFIYNAGGQLKVYNPNVKGNFELLLWNGSPNSQLGKPFTLPEGCVLYKYLAGTVNGKKVAKIVTLSKLPVEDITGKRTDSIINVYNLDMKTLTDRQATFHGPKEYVLKNQDINRLEAMLNEGGSNPGLQLLYTANQTSKVIKESEMDMASGNIETGIVEEACTLYRWNEPMVTSAKMNTLYLDKAIVLASDTKIKATMEAENTGSAAITSVSYEITDADNRTLVSKTKAVDLFPGETMEISEEFPPHKDWKLGPMRLTASVTSCKSLNPTGDELTTAIDDDDGAVYALEGKDFLLDLSVSDRILDSGHYASVSVKNESIVPSADNTSLYVYRLEENEMPEEGDQPLFEFNLKALKEGNYDDVERGARSHRYNISLPLSEYWNDENCSGVLIMVSSGDKENMQVAMQTLNNPYTADRTAVAAQINNPNYGVTEGEGYFLPSTPVELVAKPNKGYRFVDWRNLEGDVISTDTSYAFTTEKNQPVTVKAQFEETGELHRVTLIPNQRTEIANGKPRKVNNGLALARDASSVGDHQNMCYVIDHGKSVTVTAEPIFGYEFVAWQDEDGNVLSRSEDYTFNVARELTLHAIFQSKSKFHTVYFDAQTNGGITTVSSMKTNEAGKLESLPVAEKRGATFLGWYTQATGGTRVTVSTVYTENTMLYAQFTGKSSSGGSGSTSALPFNFDYESDNVKDGKVDATILTKDAVDAAKAGKNYVLVRNANEISPAAMKAVYEANKTLSIYADTTLKGVTMLRLYLNPALGKELKNNILLGGAVTSEVTKAHFEYHFSNKLAVLHLNQNETFGMPVGIAARIDLSRLDTKKLHFYSYNPETNIYHRVNTTYYIDTNGYLRFATTLAGDIVITDEPLKLK